MMNYRTKIIEMARQGQELCETLERGQADTPLADHFNKIEEDVDNAPFSVVLFGLTSEARSAALAWLYGKDFSVLSVHVVKQLGLVEISLRERGFTIERANGKRLEFDRLDPFMEALQESDILSPYDGKEWVDPVRLGVNTPKGLQGLTVFMPESPEMILKNPGLLNRIVTQANLLVVAAPLHYDITDQDQKSILEISQNMDAFWPLLVIDELEEDTSIPKIGWWQRHNSPSVQIKPQLLTTHISANIPNMLLDVNDATRKALFLTLMAKRVVHASEAVEERITQESRQLQSRKNRELRKSKAGEDESKQGQVERHQWDNLRNSVNDDLTRVFKQYQETCKKSLLTDSPLAKSVETAIEKLSLQDIDQEPGHKVIKLTISDRFFSATQDQLKTTLKSQLKDDAQQLDKALLSKQEKLEQEARSLNNAPVNLVIERIPLDDIWALLKEQLGVSLRYRGEIPKRGFLNRLSDGRKAIMGIAMMAMVLGGTFKALWGVDFRASVMLLAPIIFIGATIYSYIVWPKEDAERMAKELDRIKDSLSSELKRQLSELQREKQSKISDHIEDEKKKLARKIEELMRAYLVKQEQLMSGQKEQAQKRLKQIDQQSQDLQAMNRQVNTFKKKCDQLERDSVQQLKQLS